MQTNLIGKTALITGASSGLGERMATILAEQGAFVILTARCQERLLEVGKNIPNSAIYTMDVANSQSVQNTFKQIEEDHHRIDICINNAGIARLTPIFESDYYENFEMMMKLM